MIIEGRALTLGNNINTDVIIPGKYLTLLNPKELAKHVMEGIEPGFHKKIRENPILAVGTHFGCGSSREQAPLALKHSGAACIIGESFARIFFRNAINIGLPILECKDTLSNIHEGDFISIYLNEGKILNHANNKVLYGTILPEFILEIIKDGGLIEHLRKKSGDENV
jgi:3-isopropylmalate dehydratase small subunit